MKKEELLGIFVQGAARYFEEATGEKAEVGAPYLVGPNDFGTIMLNNAAIIGITGGHRGSIIFMAEDALASSLARRMGETDPDPSLCADVVGEVANTIAGNARRDLGRDFMISVPVLLSGRVERMHLPRGIDTFVLPVTWQGLKSYLAVSLEGAH